MIISAKEAVSEVVVVCHLDDICRIACVDRSLGTGIDNIAAAFYGRPFEALVDAVNAGAAYELRCIGEVGALPSHGRQQGRVGIVVLLEIIVDALCVVRQELAAEIGLSAESHLTDIAEFALYDA